MVGLTGSRACVCVCACESSPCPSNSITCRFQLERCKNIDTYVSMKGNKGQLCWLWKKVGKWVESATVGGALVQEVPASYMYMIPILIRVHMCIQ